MIARDVISGHTNILSEAMQRQPLEVEKWHWPCSVWWKCVVRTNRTLPLAWIAEQNKQKKAHWDVSERPLSFWKSCPRPSQGQRPKSVKASTTTLLERFKHEWAEQRGYFKREKSMVNQAVETETGRAPANLCPGRISLQMCSAASRPPSAREMEWVRNNYFLLSLISKSGMQMETEEMAAGAWSQGRRQAMLANQSGSVGAQTNQILLWIIAAWAYYRDTTSLWWLTIN